MELKKYLEIIARRKWLIFVLFIILILSIVAGTMAIPPKYTSVARLRVMTPKNGGTNYVDFNIYYATRLVNTYVSLVTSTAVENELINTLHLTKMPKVEAVAIADSELIKITVQETDPDQSAAIANTLADILVSNSGNYVSEINQAAEKAFSERLAAIDETLAKERETYKEILVPYTQNNTRISVLTAQIDYNQRLYISIKDRYEQGLQLVIVPTPKPDAISLTQQLADLTAQINQDKKTLEALTNKAAEDAIAISAAERRVNLTEDEYSGLLQQLDQIRAIQAIQGTQQLAVVDRAVAAATPSSPNLPLAVILGSVISLFVALLIGFIVDNLDDTLHSSAQIEAETGEIPLGKLSPVRHPNQVILGDKETDYHKDIDHLQLVVQRLAKKRNLKSLLISNVDPHADGSSLGFNLAREYARQGQRVIIIDVNLRMSKMHPDQEGLSQVLNEQITLEQAIKLGTVENLAVLNCGPKISNPAYLLGSEKMKSIIAQLSNDFDMVILSSPPILLAGDVDELVTFVDGVVLVLERGRTKGNDLSTAIGHLKELDAPYLGYVINQAEVGKSTPAIFERLFNQKNKHETLK